MGGSIKVSCIWCYLLNSQGSGKVWQVHHPRPHPGHLQHLHPQHGQTTLGRSRKFQARKVRQFSDISKKINRSFFTNIIKQENFRTEGLGSFSAIQIWITMDLFLTTEKYFQNKRNTMYNILIEITTNSHFELMNISRHLKGTYHQTHKG